MNQTASSVRSLLLMLNIVVVNPVIFQYLNHFTFSLSFTDINHSSISLS